MARALNLQNLVAQAPESRDADWEGAFFQALIESNLTIADHEPRIAEDGWPYLYVRTDHDSREPTLRILNWLSTRGIGLIVNGHKPEPDYVFTYGMVWNFRERGQFYTPIEQQIYGGEVTYHAGQNVLAGAPSVAYLPDYVRDILREFFHQQGLDNQKVLVISRDQKNFDLCFSLDALGNPPQEEHAGVAQAISWFLPRHYSIVLVKESGLPKFFPL